jgi:hypothetical protein
MLRLYGNLWLENPEQHLDEGQLATLNTVMAAIQGLANRGAITREGDYNLEHKFEEFKARETLAWRELGVERPPEFLIPPAGSLEAPVACHLHNPMFHVDNPHKAILEDASNPTICQLSRAGFSSANSFIFDQVSRRDETEIYLSCYPEKLRHIHENFALQLRRQMKAVVENCWGKAVRKRMLECVDLVPLPLWGEYKDMTLYLEYENDELKRFVLFAYHPQFFCYRTANSESGQKWRSLYGRRQDQLLTVAARLGGMTYHAGFYEFHHNPGSYGRLSAKQRATKGYLIAEALEQLKTASPESFVEMETRRARSVDWDMQEYAPEIERTVAALTTNTPAQDAPPNVRTHFISIDETADVVIAIRTTPMTQTLVKLAIPSSRSC